ncbi:MAG: Asp-tRNA(Asn)/Glu-tRNA(Gln) amidotransferase GatCAB subunit B, partial [Synechococcales cyanobacterium CRU_2_2]|nr:Asp-tRNA(Asn)/Glu-tRNA(Gln) amidotransferase GatCAB subunit B [Synechococcales cyanobacterium CRU_2_2]
GGTPEGLTQTLGSGGDRALIDAVMAANPDKVEQFRAGKTKLQGFFVGQLMKQSGGRVDPQLSNQILTQKLQG